MRVQTIIEHLGYPANQAKIYLASLKMGEAAVSTIAEQVVLPRTTVAELLLALHKHGMMNYYIKHGRKYWVAESPNRLMGMLKEREIMLASALPQLRGMRYRDGDKPNVRFYSGFEEIQNVFDDIIETKHHIKALVSWNDFLEYMGNRFVSDFIERRNKHFLKIQMLTVKTPYTLNLKTRDSAELRQTRFLPENILIRHVANYIYDSKVAIIFFNHKEPMGLIIEDPGMAHVQNVYFENLWRQTS